MLLSQMMACAALSKIIHGCPIHTSVLFFFGKKGAFVCCSVAAAQDFAFWSPSGWAAALMHARSDRSKILLLLSLDYRCLGI